METDVGDLPLRPWRSRFRCRRGNSFRARVVRWSNDLTGRPSSGLRGDRCVGSVRGVPTGTGQRLYLRSLWEFESRLIPGSELADGVGNPVFSPDGASIAFFSDGTLKRIPVTGGTPVTICPAEQVYGMTWDSSGLVFGQARGVFRCPENGGAKEQLATVEDGERPHGAQTLPDGDGLLFTIAKITDLTERWDKAQIVVQSISSGTRTTIVNGGGDARYDTGHLLYSVGGIAYAVPFDPGRRAINGGAVRVVEGVRRGEAAQSGASQLATSATGTLTYIPGPVVSTSIERAVAIADRTGAVTRLTLPLRPYVHVRASRDGTRIAFDSDDGKQAIIWTHELAGTGTPARLTFAGKNRFPVWAPDGQRVAFQSDREGDLAIFVQRIDGTGQIERLTKPEKGDVHVPESWSPDGRHISFSVIKGSASSLWTVSVDDKKAAPFGDVHSTEAIGSVFSPNGRWIAYHSRADDAGPIGRDSASTGVYIQPFPATGARYQAPKLEIDFQPIWSPDGNELIYVPLAASGRMATVRLSTGVGRHGRPAAIFSGGGHCRQDFRTDASLRHSARRAVHRTRIRNGVRRRRLGIGNPRRSQLARRAEASRANEVTPAASLPTQLTSWPSGTRP